MEDNGYDSNQSRSIDWGVVPCGLEEVMAVCISLRHSREDSTRQTTGSVRRDSRVSAQRTLDSYGAGSARSRRAKNLSFPITRPADFESHREWVACRGKERIRIAEAYVAEELAKAVVWAAADEKAIHTGI
ncbi:E3 ubiquitin-protein ligase XB3 [Hordeum vulgare]|nr:E3 ubiquitin-protein ligase XB3 [Hordeum vulgare]